MRRTAALLLAAALAVSAAGCGAGPAEKLTPKVAPPVIGQAGVLRAGVDLTYPPFGGTDKEMNAGLDYDVAAALAERLGLTLQVVSVQPTSAAAALSSGTVDVVVAALPIDGDLLASVTFAGSYVNDGPCLFVSVEGTATEVPTLTVDTLGDREIGVQEGSAAYWLLEDRLGQDETVKFPTLREAFQALASGTVGVVAADGIAGSYIARDFPTVRFAGQAAPARPLGVAVKKDSAELEAAVREALDALAADGVLDQLRSKWSTPLPELEVQRTEP